VPLCTGAEEDGEAYFGVVLAFSPLPGLPAPIVLGLAVLEALDVVEALELREELLLEEPQPASTQSAATARNVAAALLIGQRTLA
jgi:hypothetical protein